MNGDFLSDAVSRFGDNPEGISQFRKVVIGLAIAGKLVGDGQPLSHAEMLNQIESEKTRLLRDGQISRPKRYSLVTDEQLPEAFSDPSSFVPLGSVARIEKGLTGIKAAKSGKFPLVVTAAERASCDHYDFEAAATIVPLVSSTGHGNASINRLHYQEGRFALGTILAAIFPFAPDLISARFIFEYLSTFKDELLVSRMTGTANVTLSVGKIAEVPIPLICPTVQRKADVLMALCDQLEAARDTFTLSTLAKLNTPDPETISKDARFALANLTPLTTRPDQIKQLRQTIFNLAVRGKLVEQVPCDGSAATQLQCIEEERNALVRARAIRREKPLEPIDEGQVPFGIPPAWLWSRIGEVALFTQYGTSEKSEPSAQGVPVLTMGNIQDGLVVWNNEKRIPASSEELPSLFLKKFDLLYNRTNSAELVGKTGIYLGEDDCRTFASYLIRIRCSTANSLPAYVNLAMNAPVFRETQIVPLIKQQTGQANVNGTALKNMLIPLPPLAEQQRIVVKVDELMALCDQLEASLATSEHIRSRLLEAVLHKALEPA